MSVDVPDAEGALGEIVIAGYRLRSLIAAEAGGVRVYAATSEESGIAATVRLAPIGDANAGRRFTTDAEALAGLRNANVPSVLAHGESAEGLYFVTEEVVGRELPDIIGPDGLAPLRAVKLLGDVADALDRAHAAGLLHRAIRPSTVIVESHPVERAVLTSFEIGRERTTTEITADQAPYTSPEEARGEPPTATSDVYSLACVLYECVTGAPPFGRDPEEALDSHISDDPPPAGRGRPIITSGLDSALARGLAKNPNERYATAGELVADAARAAFALAPSVPEQGGPSVDEAEPTDGERDGDGATTELPVMVAGPHIRRGRPVPVWATILVLFLATCAGWAAARALDDNGTPKASSGGVEVVVPAGWSDADRPASIKGLNIDLPIYLTPGPNSPTGLVAGIVPGQKVLIDPRTLAAAVQPNPPRPESVRLGDATAWRWQGLKTTNPKRVVTLYAIPTSAGTAAIACYGPPGAEKPPTACSEAAASTRIPGETTYDPVDGAAWRGNVRTATAALARNRSAARARLAKAKSGAAQAAAATSLANAHRRALAAIEREGVPPQAATAHSAISGDLQALQADYEDLAKAAKSRNRAAYRRALRAVSRDDARLRAELRSI